MSPLSVQRTVNKHKNRSRCLLSGNSVRLCCVAFFGPRVFLYFMAKGRSIKFRNAECYLGREVQLNLRMAVRQIKKTSAISEKCTCNSMLSLVVVVGCDELLRSVLSACVPFVRLATTSYIAHVECRMAPAPASVRFHNKP